MKDVKSNGGRKARSSRLFPARRACRLARNVRSDRALELFLDIYNITNRPELDNPVTANQDRGCPQPSSC